MRIKYQQEEYLESSITKVFHFLELQGSSNFLIGSNRIRNILYSNDFDLNSNLKVQDTKTILKKVYEEFLHVFHEAYKNPDYYILDFKNGYYNNEPIRWTYDAMKKGYVIIDNKRFTFEECLTINHEDNLLKLDLCYINNGIFTDINVLYNVYIIKNHSDLNKAKVETKKGIIDKLNENIRELEKSGEYYKALKRCFSLSIIKGKVDKDILGIMNSEFGMFYKFISFLELILSMLEQNFKPIDLVVIKSNLEYIKQFASHIVSFKVEPFLDEINKVRKMGSKRIVEQKLRSLVDSASRYLNRKTQDKL